MNNHIYRVILLIYLPFVLIGQKEDHVWLLGYSTYDIVDEEIAMDTTSGASNINYNYNPPKVYHDPNRFLDFGGTNASICDSLGNLLMYTNGQSLLDGNHNEIDDTINYNAEWEYWSFTYDGVLINEGLPYIQSALILPVPESNDQYYVFYQSYNHSNTYFEKLRYAKYSLGANKLLVKDVSIIEDSIGGGGLLACMHANGRDWWLVQVGRNNSDLHLFLITPDSIHNIGIQYDVGSKFRHSLGQASFSPDGSKLGINSGFKLIEKGVEVGFMDFDRCSGEFSNPVQDSIDAHGVSTGMSFSLNSRYAYASNSLFVYQYDMQADNIIYSRKIAAEYDGYEYFYTPTSMFGFDTTLGWMGLAPDGKIYISSSSGSNHKMHVMHYPDREGENSDLRQHSLHIPTSYARTIPNFPNYRLGPLDGSPCDTLGIDNIPVAKFRCDQDTLDELSFQFIDLSYFEPAEWTWIINGEQISEQHPIYDFEENGVYSVCLEVRNNNGFDTTCKTISLGVSSAENEKKEIPLTLFPNPVKDILTVSLHDYYPVNAQFILYDIQGRKVFSNALYSTWNSYDINFLSSGTYVYKIIEGNETLKGGKFLKI